MALSKTIRGGLESLMGVFSSKEDLYPKESAENVANRIRVGINKIRAVYNERATGERSSSDPTKVYKEIEEALYSLKRKGNKKLYRKWKREYEKIK